MVEEQIEFEVLIADLYRNFFFAKGNPFPARLERS